MQGVLEFRGNEPSKDYLRVGIASREKWSTVKEISVYEIINVSLLLLQKPQLIVTVEELKVQKRGGENLFVDSDCIV